MRCSLSLLLLAPLLLPACATMDDFLELPLGEEPAVYFKVPVEPAAHDTVVVAGVEGAEVIDGLSTRTLRLFLKTPGHHLRAVTGAAPPSAFLPFRVANATQRSRLIASHPQLAGRTLYLLRLDRMQIRRGALAQKTTLAAATPSSLSTRQQRRLAGHTVDFLLLPVPPGNGPTTPATYAAVE